MTEPAAPPRFVRWVLGAVLLAHLGFLAWGAADPEASLRFDRTGRRLTSARLLADATGPAEAASILRTRGAPGDYAWHAAVLAPTGESLLAVQVVQLVLWALSLAALFAIVRELDGRREAAWLAVAIYALIPIDFAIPHYLASEAFFNPLLVFGVLGLVRYALGGLRLATLAWTGLAFGLAALTRTEGLPWMLVMWVVAAVVTLREAPRRAALHLSLLAALTFAPVSLHLAVTPSLPVDLDRAALSLSWELANRAQRVIEAGGGDTSRIEAEPLAAFLRAGLDHPGAFVREWALQAGKLLALPDNLDLFRYLGAYEYTGRRSEWVHELGVVGAARRSFEEMPVLSAWLVASILAWMGVAAFALRGAAVVLRDSRGARWLLYVLLLALPLVWTALRVLAQGESRKRSPVDFAIAIFAALGAMESWRARYTRGQRAGGGAA